MDWEGKKILRIKELNFLLPEDFEGDFNDALQALIDYRKSIGAGKICNYNVSDNNNGAGWNNFCDTVFEGKRLNADASLCVRKKDKWEDI